MKKEYQKPEVEIISFMAEETIADQESKSLPGAGMGTTSGEDGWA